MRFFCDSCRAQYTINDDKVGPRGVKVRCKKCGHAIVVRPGGTEAPEERTVVAGRPVEPEGAQATQIWRNPLLAAAEPSDAPGLNDDSPVALSALDEDEVGAALDQALKSSPSARAAPASEDSPLAEDEDDRVSTRIMNVEAIKRAAIENSSASNGVAQKDGQEWFVAIDEKQVGPLNLDKLRQLWERGEITADSLCWRAGFPDWVPLSEVNELTFTLSPRPNKPMIVASNSGVSVSQMAPSPTRPGEGSRIPENTVAEWRPSAASALASLVREEVNALAQKPPTAGGALAIESSRPADFVAPATAPVTNGVADAGALRSPLAMPPTYAPVGAYPYAMGGAPRNRGLWIGLSVGGGLLLLLVAAVVVLAFRQPVIVQQAVPVETPARAEVPPEKPAAPELKTPAVEPVRPMDSEKLTELAQADKPKEAEVVKEKVEEKRPLPRKESNRPRVTESRAEAPERVVEKPVVSKPSAGGDDFDKLFGGESKGAPRAKEVTTGSKPPSVYVPPAPGAGSDIPERLGQADIMQVVLSQKSALTRCVDEHRKRAPDVRGTLVMRWTVSTSGKTLNVTVVSDEFKSTYIASCVGSLVKGWNFPRHRVQGEPVQFPFKF